jgi:hypothetical protein
MRSDAVVVIGVRFQTPSEVFRAAQEGPTHLHRPEPLFWANESCEFSVKDGGLEAARSDTCDVHYLVNRFGRRTSSTSAASFKAIPASEAAFRPFWLAVTGSPRAISVDAMIDRPGATDALRVQEGGSIAVRKITSVSENISFVICF